MSRTTVSVPKGHSIPLAVRNTVEQHASANGGVIPPANAGDVSQLTIKAVSVSVMMSKALTDENGTQVHIVPKKRSMLDRLARPVPQNDNNAYVRHISELDSILQSELLKYDLDLKLKLVAVNTVNNRIRSLIDIGDFGNENHLYPNQIETFVEIVHCIIKEPWRSMVLIGSTQLGKTMTVLLDRKSVV